MYRPIPCVLAVAACASTEPSAPATRAATPAAFDATAVARSWHADRIADRPMGDTPTTGGDHDGALVIAYTDHDGAQVSVALPESEHHDAASIARDGDDTLYVVHYDRISTGAQATRIDTRTGAVVWNVHLHGVGEILHSEYRNVAQIEVVDHHPVIHGEESGGAYVEVLDADGHPLTTHAVPDALVRIDPPLTAAPSLDVGRSPVELRVGAMRCRFVEAGASDETASLACYDGDALRWSVSLPGNGMCGRAALLELDSRIWLARWCAITSGAHLLAFDAADGRVRLDRAMRALLGVDHSEYFAGLTLTAAGRFPVVAGVESAGRYVEVIDPDSGETLVSRTLRE